jgi:hypothetical protein
MNISTTSRYCTTTLHMPTCLTEVYNKYFISSAGRRGSRIYADINQDGSYRDLDENSFQQYQFQRYPERDRHSETGA